MSPSRSPTTATSRSRRARSTAVLYQTGGGRTVDANSIDILFTWLVNHDREFLQGGATGATKPGMKVFPYFATPNTELQTVAKSVALDADPDEVWSAIGSFDLSWHPRVARVRLTGTGIGQLRTMETLDGKEIVERLEAIDNAKRSMRYTNIAGIAASHYTGTLEVKPKGRGCGRRMARAIPGERPTRYRREDHRVGIAEDGSRKSDDSFWSSGVSAIADLDDRVHRRPMGRSPRSTWRARAVARGHVSRRTRAARALPRRLSTTSVWRRNFSAIWTRSTVWMRSPRNSPASTTRFAQRWFTPRSLRRRIASTMHEATSRVPRRWADRARRSSATG